VNSRAPGTVLPRIEPVRSILVATGNRGKFEEIKAFLAGDFDRFASLADFETPVDVVEDMPTYFENSLKKARKVGNLCGMNTLADDSGLEVEALDGRPGLHTARYASSDAERIDRLLRELDGVPRERRGAAFKAYLAYYEPVEGLSFIFYGVLRGYIGFERKGQTGFGFDPVFMLPELGKSLAEIGTEEKNRISHRGRALQAFKRFLQAQAF
jgi:XTP/dITP diphosphohydrolase